MTAGHGPEPGRSETCEQLQGGIAATKPTEPPSKVCHSLLQVEGQDWALGAPGDSNLTIAGYMNDI